MPTYSMHIGNRAPKEAQKGAISIVEAKSLNEAKNYFAQRKQLSLGEFNKLFTVIEIKELNNNVK